MTVPEQELKLCPFCGSADLHTIKEPRDDENENEVIGPASVHCGNCRGGIFGDFLDDAIDAWNRRPLPNTQKEGT